MWSSLDTGPETSFKKLVFRSPVLLKMRDETGKYLKEVLCEHNGQVPLRDDYDELARTSLSVLGEIPPTGIKWMEPGASHKTRFMADAFYTNKMHVFHPSLGYDKAIVTALRRVVQVNCLLYVPQFLKAAIGTDAAVNDHHFVQQLLPTGQWTAIWLTQH